MASVAEQASLPPRSAWSLTRGNALRGMTSGAARRLSAAIITTAITCWAGSAFAASYEVGPGKAYENISDVPLDSLDAGDEVVVYYRAEPYRESFGIERPGTQANPITIRGVAGLIAILDRAWPLIEERGISLLGVSVGNLSDVDAVQLVLPFERNESADLDTVLDAIRDRFGRSALVRLLLGGAVSLGIGLVAAVLAVGIGTGVGATAGFVGGRFDAGGWLKNRYGI